MLFPTDLAPRWTVDPNGIEWKVEASAPAHVDHIETSGEMCSLMLSYGTGEAGVLVQKPRVVWPMLRTLPNDTHASLQAAFDGSRLSIDGAPVAETLEKARLDGVINLHSRGGGLEIKRTWFVDRMRPVAVERVVVRNGSDRTVQVSLVPDEKVRETDPAKGLQGAYSIRAVAWNGEAGALRPRQTREMAVYYVAHPSSEAIPALPKSPGLSEKERRAFVRKLDGLLDLQTPNANVNRMFRFAKVRAAESLFRTKGGLVHSPGGGAYYAAIWANDQAEYANPLFGYLGYDKAREAAETSWEWFARYMNSEFRPIPSSIIAEGTSFWNGAGDRGDMAMIAYGASRYALARGDRATATRLWPLIEWCLDYLERKKGPEGVLMSDSDELEGRFPAGKANLNTSCLAYDGLLSAASLAEDLGQAEKAKGYRARADALRKAIERYFGETVEGFDTYRYYDGNDVLRAWIATPLTVGLFERAKGTIDALFSPRLWTADGLASQAGSTTFWDRATLYGFRGVLAAGDMERAMPKLLDYTNRRLTGDHVPYAVEAYPEGNQRHLSAESGLYVRAITEGLFGLRPLGLRKFELNPRLPAEWPTMSLRNVSIAGTVVGIQVKGDECEVTAKGGKSKRYPLGKPFVVDLAKF
ncbi:hypothetical protein EON82_00175 [bacterium]|nr:MAG: hypothetical protein EON82_00175 [bacterium]